MHVLDIMAEAKMRKWEQDKKEGKIEPKSNADRICVNTSDSLEKQLYEDIKRLIVRSKQEAPLEKELTLKEVEKIQIQLLARIERSGGYHLSKLISDEIRNMKNQKE